MSPPLPLRRPHLTPRHLDVDLPRGRGLVDRFDGRKDSAEEAAGPRVSHVLDDGQEVDDDVEDEDDEGDDGQVEVAVVARRRRRRSRSHFVS